MSCKPFIYERCKRECKLVDILPLSVNVVQYRCIKKGKVFVQMFFEKLGGVLNGLNWQNGISNCLQMGKHKV